MGSTEGTGKESRVIFHKMQLYLQIYGFNIHEKVKLLQRDD